MFLDNVLRVMSYAHVEFMGEVFDIACRSGELQMPIDSSLSFIAPNGILGVQFPISRDWAYDYIPCKAHNCAANVSGYCISPACCVIGENGKCKGYHPRVTEKDGSSDTKTV